MSISFGGVGELCVTFKADNNVVKGLPVKMSANDTVTACSANDRIMGVAIDVADDGYCTVQIAGYVTLPYSSTAPSVGYAKLAANGSGGVLVPTASNGITPGGEYLVINVDSANTTVGLII